MKEQCKCGGRLVDIQSLLVGHKVICMECGVSGKSESSVEAAAKVQRDNLLNGEE